MLIIKCPLLRTLVSSKQMLATNINHTFAHKEHFVTSAAPTVLPQLIPLYGLEHNILQVFWKRLHERVNFKSIYMHTSVRELSCIIECAEGYIDSYNFETHQNS